jgi:hypothetical protein
VHYTQALLARRQRIEIVDPALHALLRMGFLFRRGEADRRQDEFGRLLT